MTDAERNALVERMTDAAADAYMDNEWITFTAAMRAAIRAALAVAEPVVREDERQRNVTVLAKEGHHIAASLLDDRGAA